MTACPSRARTGLRWMCCDCNYINTWKNCLVAPLSALGLGKWISSLPFDGRGWQKFAAFCAIWRVLLWMHDCLTFRISCWISFESYELRKVHMMNGYLIGVVLHQNNHHVLLSVGYQTRICNMSVASVTRHQLTTEASLAEQIVGCMSFCITCCGWYFPLQK